MFFYLSAEGVGGARDITKAVQYFQLASHGGHLHAIYLLGDMHADGAVVKRNCHFAVEVSGVTLPKGTGHSSEMMFLSCMYCPILLSYVYCPMCMSYIYCPVSIVLYLLSCIYCPVCIVLYLWSCVYAVLCFSFIIPVYCPMYNTVVLCSFIVIYIYSITVLLSCIYCLVFMLCCYSY